VLVWAEQRPGLTAAGKSEIDPIRTSSGMFFSRGQNALITRIEARLAAWTHLQPGNGEGIQVRGPPTHALR
jgi:prolyl 4-hydroxylase